MINRRENFIVGLKLINITHPILSSITLTIFNAMNAETPPPLPSLSLPPPPPPTTSFSQYWPPKKTEFNDHRRGPVHVFLPGAL